MPESKSDDLRHVARKIRRWIVEQSNESNVGHIGSALSIVEIMTALWGRVMRAPGTELADRDRFILSKGHASLALYCALRWKGLLDEQTFKTYCSEGTLLGVHPEQELAGIDASTGSLGQGLSIGCGLAHGLRQKGLQSKVYVLLSDAECNEGQVWEAIMFGAHHKLSNLVAIVDLNGMQALGYTKEVLDVAPMSERWHAFGWQTTDVDGHDIDALAVALALDSGEEPRVVLARTVLGKGISFMEDELEWHYRNLSPELATKALCELEA